MVGLKNAVKVSFFRDITISHSERNMLQMYFYSEVLAICIYLHLYPYVDKVAYACLFACGPTGLFHRCKGEHYIVSGSAPYGALRSACTDAKRQKAVQEHRYEVAGLPDI